MQNERRILSTILLVAVLLWGWRYQDALSSIVRTWQSDAAFSHGFLIAPISVWLAWQKRAAIADAQFRPSWLGAMALLACAAAWMVARGAGVLVVEQLAVVAMVPALVLSVLGVQVTRALAFPLAFLVFAVPFGRGNVPLLMQVTADVATLALRWSSVPVWRSHMYISIPAGQFEVARACGGLNYVIAGLVLGVLYAYVCYRGWRKRMLCVAAFLLIPVVANGARVYFTILVSHLTDMRFGPGTEHVTFGRVFFVVLMLVLFWIGRRWHDDMSPTRRSIGQDVQEPAALAAMAWMPVPIAMFIVLLAPAGLPAPLSGAAGRHLEAKDLAALPAGTEGWQGPLHGAETWRPHYRGGLVERQGAFRLADGPPVDVFVAVYGLGATGHHEMIAFDNVLSKEHLGSLAEERRRRVRLPDGNDLVVNELLVTEPDGRRLVWYWFRVGDRSATSAFSVKAIEALALVTRRVDTARIISLATISDEDAVSRMQGFVAAHASCIEGGFAPEACAR
jgi:exosortase A